MRKAIQGFFFLSVFILSCDLYNPFNFPVAGTSSDVNTPLNVIYTLRQAYISRDLVLYLSCLHRDSFRFYFNPQDTVVQRILEVDLGIDSLVWGFEEEKKATEALFELSRSIYLEYLNPVGFYSDDSMTFYFMANYYMVIAEADNSSEIAEGKLLFELRKFNSHWYIIRWEDYPL